MKNLLSSRWNPDLSKQQRDVVLGLVIILIVAILYYFQWAYYLTGLEGSKVNIDQPARYFWWANDSRSYRDVGEWLFGRSNITSIDHRPWLYPLLLGLTRTLFGGGAESVMWILQFLMWLGSGALIYLSLHNGTGSTILALLGAGFFFSHPSPLLLTFHGMTETLNILLISAFCWVLTTQRENRIYYAIFLIALATVTKPIYLLFLILFVMYVFVRYQRSSPVDQRSGTLGVMDRQSSRLRQIGLIALLLLPIWIQLLLSLIAVGKPTLSTIGSYTFKNYLVADVYLRTEGTEWRETMARLEGWDLRQQLTYLWEHQRMTLLTLRSHLIDSNLLTGSFFALGEGNRLKEFSINLNTFAAYLHLLMSPLVLYYLLSREYQRSSPVDQQSGALGAMDKRSVADMAPWRHSPEDRENKETIALLYLCFLLQFLTSSISTGQEDRLMITALPLWIVAYLLVLSGITFHPSEPKVPVTGDIH